MSRKQGKAVSIRTILVIVAAGTILAYFVLNVLASTLFMERFYLNRTKRQMIQAYETVVQHPDGNLKVMSELDNRNLRILLVNAATKEVVYNSHVDDRLLPPMLDRMIPDITALLENDTDVPYVITPREDEELTAAGTMIKMGNTIRLGGRVGDELIVQITAQREPIENAAKIAAQFSLVTGMLLLVVTALVYRNLASRIVKPLEEMSHVASKIEQLDFSARCPEGSGNELGQLAGSINAMSDTMQQYIAQLEQANDQLRQDIQEKERIETARRTLIDNLSHDLKTPLAIISGYAEGLSSGMAKTPQAYREYCDVIEDETQRMREMLSRMLAFSQLESGAVELEPEVFSLSDLLDDLTAMFAQRAESSGIRMTLSCPPDQYVFCDFVAAEQSLTNYLQNAISHLSGEKRIEVSASVRDDRVRVEVFNTASPIPEEEQPRLWESFYRMEKSRRRQGGESGLGLAIVRSNMELMGMPYGMKNAEDGVVFWLELPVAPELPEDPVE